MPTSDQALPIGAVERDTALWLGVRGAALLRPRPEGAELFDNLDGLIVRLARDA